MLTHAAATALFAQAALPPMLADAAATALFTFAALPPVRTRHMYRCRSGAQGFVDIVRELRTVHPAHSVGFARRRLEYKRVFSSLSN